MKLTPKQSRFVEEYLVDLNATQAAIRAGYSEKTAAVIGCQNLIKLNIAEAIQAGADNRSRRLEISQDRVVLELAKLAFSDLREFATWGPATVLLRDSEELDDNAAACVQEVSRTATALGCNIKFKLHDKCPAIKMLGQHLGMFTEKIDLTVDNPREALAKLLNMKPEDLPE